MGMMSRRKGAAGEREAAEKLNEVLGTKFHRGRQYHGGPESPDLAGDLPGLHLEVKRVEALRLYPSMEQARRDAGTGEVPAVMHRMNKKPWVVIVYADDLIRLLDVIDACRARVNEGGVRSEELGVGERMHIGQMMPDTATAATHTVFLRPPSPRPRPPSPNPLPPDEAGGDQDFSAGRGCALARAADGKEFEGGQENELQSL